MYCLRRVGSEPGRLASSTRSCSESSFEMRRVCVCGESGAASRVVVEGEVERGGVCWGLERRAGGGREGV